MAEEIEQEILPGLSKEYERSDFNITYVVDEAKKYLSEQHIKIFTENIQVLLSENKLPEAEKMVCSFRPLEGVSLNIEDFIKTIHQIEESKVKPPIMYMKYWLRAGQTTIIYGGYGSGKSLLCLLIAYVLGATDYVKEKCEIGEWMVKNPTGCLYLDGEIGEQEMLERYQQFKWLGPQYSKYRLRIMSVPEYQLATEDSFFLADRANQVKIINWLKKHPNYKLIVLDSISTLFGLEDENSNSEWNNKISPFLRDLRVLGVSCLLLHHSGKGEKKGLRGASAMGAMAHNIFRLIPHPEKDEGQAWFMLSKEKQRAAGKVFRDFSLKFVQNDDKTITQWEHKEL
jgi:RecA-family ATPase